VAACSPIPPSVRSFTAHLLVRSVAVLLLIALLLIIESWSVAAASIPHLGAVSFKVLNADGTEVIGHSYYGLHRSSNNLLIGWGEAYFTDGEHDVEYDTLEARPGKAPAMLRLDHKFYNADGSMQREIAADFRTGEASCTHYQNGIEQSDSDKLDFTPDSYGGSAVVLPLEQDLAEGSTQPFKLQALNCIPKPRLIAVQASVQQPSRWSHYPGHTVEVDVKPDLGWLSAVVSPFLPRLRAWFDPSDNWAFAGGEFSRYFRGPRIMLVREIPEQFRKAENQKRTSGG
jgi:hypothetical protein